jgi:hypothetical protein
VPVVPHQTIPGAVHSAQQRSLLLADHFQYSGTHPSNQGAYHEAARLQEESSAFWRRLGESRNLAYALDNLSATLLRARGD